MEISDIKKSKDRDVMSEYAEPKPEERKRGIFKEVKMPKSLTERLEKRQEKKLQSLQAKHEYMQKKYGAELKTQQLKAGIAEMKAQRRKTSPIYNIGEAISKARAKGTSLKERASIEQSQLKREQVRRTREQERHGLDYEREYHRKFPVRNEGEGELPYYEKEEGRKLTPPCKPESPKIGIANGERIPKKKSLIDELF